MLYGPGVRCGIITDEEYIPDPEYIAKKIFSVWNGNAN